MNDTESVAFAFQDWLTELDKSITTNPVDEDLFAVDIAPPLHIDTSSLAAPVTHPAVSEAVNTLLEKQSNSSKNSYTRYKKMYLDFHQGEEHNEANLLAFIVSIKDKYAATSLQTIMSLVKKFVLLECGVCLQNTPLLKQYIEALGIEHKKKKAPALTREQIYKFLDELDNDGKNLTYKIVVLFGVFGALRMGEMVRIKWEDITIEENGVMLRFIRYKTDKAGIGQSVFIPASSNPNRNILNLIATYRQHLPKEAGKPQDRFFLTWRDALKTFIKSPIGKNTLAKIPKIVAEYNKLPEPKKYTGHSLRVTSATLLADAGTSVLNIKRHGGWKSDFVVEEYVRESKKAKVDIANTIAGETFTIATNNNNNTQVQTATQQLTSAGASSILSGAVMHNCTINITIPK